MSEQQNKPRLMKIDYLIILGGVILLVIAAFTDLQISQQLVNESSIIGQFTAQYGEVPGYLLILVALAILGYKKIKEVIDPDNNSPVSLLQLNLILIATFIASYLISNRIVEPILPQIILTLLLPFPIYFLVFYYSKHITEFYISASKKVVIITFIFPILIVIGIKMIWGRVRFRDLGSDFHNFTPWFLPQGYTGDTSFPSGHSSIAWMLLASILFIKDKTYRLIVMVICVIWGIVVSFGRVLIGAHYLSDVTFSTLSGLLVIHYYYKQHKIELDEYPDIISN